MPRAIRGVLIECEPAIKSILIHIDNTQLNNDAIIEDLDETHLMVKEQMVKTLQARLDEKLKETYRVEVPLDDSDEDKGM
ncbi:TFIIH complex subunit tfb5 [Podospora pseudopauciseta]|uniref:General transcription and DNA repair factor IIH subunit TFB5 n=1 Tax=Podospora pseudopauciseta TaxID=2093780 RepID=A0ABR0HN22_9PEZI|nr:TFIIH complex subunit tfb5 [Podospora pseudopauciseta]